MRSTSNHHRRARARAFTLIETTIYAAIISTLLASYVPYAYSLRDSDMRLFDRIGAAYDTR